MSTFSVYIRTRPMCNSNEPEITEVNSFKKWISSKF